MIVGLGIDIVEVDRIRKAIQSQPRFVERILTRKEQALYTTPQQVAGRWAAKEAIAKAVSVSLTWHDVEILTGDKGEPLASVKGLNADVKVHVTISHERGHAVAAAVCEQFNTEKQLSD